MPSSSKKFARFLLFLSLTALVVQSACGTAATATPVPNTATPTAVLPIQLTETEEAAVPTATATAVPELLTQAQQDRLHLAALKYVADSQAQAIKIAQSLNFLGVNGFPSTMCGPLAMAILRDAGMVDAGVDLTRFFDLDPRPGKDDGILRNTFPDDLYQKIEINQPAYQIDFSAHPLMVGDFIYLFAGNRGNYDHVITVERVDDAGRAYAVTNLNTSDGFVIKEVMLYDPKNPGVGQFYDWTNQRNWRLGLTGFGGMWIWRLRTQQPDPDTRTLQFHQSIEDVQKKYGGEWHILIKEVGKEPLYSSLIYDPITPASTIKLADAVLFFKVLEKKKISNIPDYIHRYGTNSRTFEQLLYAMLVNSEEEATTILENWTADAFDPNAMIHQMGYTHTFITPRQSTVDEMTRMLEDLYDGKLVSSEGRQIILNDLAESTAGDATLLGVMRQNFTSDDVLYDKRGEVASPRVIVADLGLLVKGGRTYLLAVYAYPNAENSGNAFDELSQGVEAIGEQFWNFTEGQ